jgi:hypothetical protein
MRDWIFSYFISHIVKKKTINLFKKKEKKKKKKKEIYFQLAP